MRKDKQIIISRPGMRPITCPINITDANGVNWTYEGNGTSNIVYKGQINEKYYVYRIPLDNDPANSPMRLITLLNKINAGLGYPDAILYLEGSIAPFIERHPESDDPTHLKLVIDKICNKLIDIYVLHGKVVLDACVKGNFIEDKDGKLYCVDPGEAYTVNRFVKEMSSDSLDQLGVLDNRYHEFFLSYDHSDYQKVSETCKALLFLAFFYPDFKDLELLKNDEKFRKTLADGFESKTLNDEDEKKYFSLLESENFLKNYPKSQILINAGFSLKQVRAIYATDIHFSDVHLDHFVFLMTNRQMNADDAYEEVENLDPAEIQLMSRLRDYDLTRTQLMSLETLRKIIHPHYAHAPLFFLMTKHTMNFDDALEFITIIANYFPRLEFNHFFANYFGKEASLELGQLALEFFWHKKIPPKLIESEFINEESLLFTLLINFSGGEDLQDLQSDIHLRLHKIQKTANQSLLPPVGLMSHRLIISDPRQIPPIPTNGTNEENSEVSSTC